MISCFWLVKFFYLLFYQCMVNKDYCEKRISAAPKRMTINRKWSAEEAGVKRKPVPNSLKSIQGHTKTQTSWFPWSILNDRLAVLPRLDEIQHASSSVAGWQIAFQRFPRDQVIESALRWRQTPSLPRQQIRRRPSERRKNGRRISEIFTS